MYAKREKVMKPYNLFSIVTLLLLVLTSAVQAAKIVTIGVVIDGPIEHVSWSPELFKNELRVLTEDDFDIRFPLSKQIDGNWSANRISASLKQLQEDPDVDIVLALGYVSSAIATSSKSLQKPTFAPFIMDAALQGLSEKNNTSGIKNLNYLSSGADFVRDLQVFKSVTDCKKIAVLIDEANYAAQPGLIHQARKVTSAAGVELVFIQQRSRNEDLAARLPDDIDSVVITDLARLGPVAMEHLIAALIKKKLPSYSLLDSHLVKLGLLMSEAPATDWRRLARRNALNIHAVMHGEPADRQPVYFTSKRRLTINMSTARAIGIYPHFHVLNEAVMIHEEPEPKGRTLTLSEVAKEALTANLDLRSAALGLEVGQTNVDQSRAKLMPQLNASIGYTQLNDHSTRVISGAASEQSTAATLRLIQLIYADSANADVDIQRYLQENRKALIRQLELDIILEATTSFLNLLKAQTFVHIRREEMHLSRTNLELARDRQKIGVANPAEVYRWESELITSRKGLLNAQAQLQQIRDTLNRLLHRPLNEPFIAEPATLEDPGRIVSRKELFEYVSNDRAFELMGEFMTKEGLAVSPELRAIEALLSVVKRELKLHRRAYWTPTVVLQGEVTNVLHETRTSGFSAEHDTDWSIGVNISLPLYEGGARDARLSGSRLAFSQQLSQRDAIRERIQQRVRATLHRIKASYPSIQLSKEGTNSARKNLDLVTNAYSRGTVSILDLLDAQNTALVAKESATNAVFDFLIDLMSLQHSMGGFDFFLDKEGLDGWLERLQRYITNAKVRRKTSSQ